MVVEAARASWLRQDTPSRWRTVSWVLVQSQVAQGTMCAGCVGLVFNLSVGYAFFKMPK